MILTIAKFRGAVTSRISDRARGFSLVELLVCVVIISILTLISVNGYQGALDQQDLKYAAPAIAGRLDSLRREASEKDSVITVDMQIGKAEWTITRRKGAETNTVHENLSEVGIIKRKHVFLRYEWPEGGTTPATFTFPGGSKAQGGKVFFGTSRAETSIAIVGGKVHCDMGIHMVSR